MSSYGYIDEVKRQLSPTRGLSFFLWPPTRPIMARATTALAFAQLEALTADAAPLSPEASECVAASTTAAGGAPSFAALASSLGIPATPAATDTDTDTDTAARPADRLPLRIVSGEATPAERSCWRTYAASGLHELLSQELIEALAARIKATLPRDHTRPEAAPRAQRRGSDGRGTTSRAKRSSASPSDRDRRAHSRQAAERLCTAAAAEGRGGAGAGAGAGAGGAGSVEAPPSSRSCRCCSSAARATACSRNGFRWHSRGGRGSPRATTAGIASRAGAAPPPTRRR